MVLPNNDTVNTESAFPVFSAWHDLIKHSNPKNAGQDNAIIVTQSIIEGLVTPSIGKKAGVNTMKNNKKI